MELIAPIREDGHAMTIAHEELTRPDRHIFLSPHYDDIALSCGGTAAVLSAAGRTPEVALIFGDHPDPDQPLTSFAEYHHQLWGMSPDEVIAARRAEERMASVALGTCDRFLPFRDAIYRGDRYLSDDDLFGSVRPDEADLHESIIAELRLGENDAPNARIYAPLAIGNHVDHQHAYLAGRALVGRRFAVWFYEDLPYGLKRANVDARLEQIRGDGLHPGVAVDISSQWNRKIDAIMAYPSQLSTVFGKYVDVGTSRAAIDEAMTTYARSAGDGVPVERFWSVHE